MGGRAVTVLIFRTRDGRKLTYRKLGHGPVLVIHPGGPGFSSAYLDDLAGLGEEFTLVMLNPRGTGDSDRPSDPGAYRLDDYVSDLDDLREHLALERMLLLGYSHGGFVAQAYAVAHPARVSKLVLACTAARFGPEQEAATAAAMANRSGETWYPAAAAAADASSDQLTDEQLRDGFLRMMPLYFARFGPAEAEYVDSLRSITLNGDAGRAFGKEVQGLDLRGGISRLTVPTLVITGAEDFICGPVCAGEMTTAIPGARECVVVDAGHMVFMEQPRVFHDEVAAFLAS